MIEMSHLVVNGCSFTYCQELEDPKTQGWPALLAKKLGVPVVNLAYCGSGNDGIARRSMEYHFKDKKNNNKPFYIHAWSYLTRREDYFKPASGEFLPLDIGGSSRELMASAGFRITMKMIPNISTQDSLINLSLKIAERKKMYWWISMMHFFKANNVPFLMTDYMPTYDKGVSEYIENDYIEMRDYIENDISRLTNFNTLTRKLPKMPDNHDGYEAQYVLADYCYNEIISRYGEVKPVDLNYFKLAEFYPPHVRSALSHNLQWI